MLKRREEVTKAKEEAEAAESGGAGVPRKGRPANCGHHLYRGRTAEAGQPGQGDDAVMRRGRGDLHQHCAVCLSGRFRKCQAGCHNEAQHFA